MKDIIGVEIKKGDLVMNYASTCGGSPIRRFEMVVDWTDSNLIVGPTEQKQVGYGKTKKYQKRRKMFPVNRSIVVNQYWGKVLHEIEKNPPKKQGYFRENDFYCIDKALRECGVKPNIGDVRFPDDVEDTHKNLTTNKDDLSEI